MQSLQIAVKKNSAAAAERKTEQLEKKQELEKRLQDVAGALGNAQNAAAKRAKKGNSKLIILILKTHFVYISDLFLQKKQRQQQESVSQLHPLPPLIQTLLHPPPLRPPQIPPTQKQVKVLHFSSILQ